jgi:hypothetical protein
LEENNMARVGRCQSVIIGNKTYNYGEVIPYLRWKFDNVTENEIWNAKIVGVSGMRENNVSFDGEDNNGNSVSVSIDMDDVIE